MVLARSQRSKVSAGNYTTKKFEHMTYIIYHIVYIESCSASREEAIQAVCDMFSAVLNDWIRPYAPTMTNFNSLTTSSGYIYNLQ